MTEERIKEWLRELEVRKTQIQIWIMCLDYEGDKHNEYQKLVKQKLQVELIEKALQILEEEEKLVIESHLIAKKNWNNTYKIYEDKWGMHNACSLRTLKRMQTRGLHKMLDFIKKSDLEKYF